MRRVLGWASGIILLIGVLAAANLRRYRPAIDVDWQLFRPAPPVVVVGQPTAGTITRTIAAKGILEPVHQAQVVAKINGKVAEVCVEEGTAVRQGDLLIKLDDSALRSLVDTTRARFDTARTNLAIAETHLRDVEKDPSAATTPTQPTPTNPLAGYPGAVAPAPATPSKLDVARNSVEGWKRERKAAEAAAEAARTDLDKTAIRAPIDGLIEDVAVEVGDDVFASPTQSALASPTPPGATAGMFGGLGVGGASNLDPRADTPVGPSRTLCRLLDPTQLRVRAWIDEADVGLVQPDQPAEIFLPDEPVVPVAGRVGKVAPRGRPNGEVVSYAAIIHFNDARPRPRPGMRVNVEIEVSRKETSLGVPVQAVLHRKRRDVPVAADSRSGATGGDDANYLKAVFVLDGDQVRLRPIETGVSDERRVEILSGLAPDDRLVVGPFRALDSLEDGGVVRAESGSAITPNLSAGLTSLGRRPTR